jgi:high frequency lysogenization protein
MKSNDRNRTIALAALFQCVEGVMQIAKQGQVNHDLFETCIHSIITKNNANIDEIYGDLDQLKKGLRILMYQLGAGSREPDGKSKDLEATRYVINLLYLEKKLSSQAERYQQVLDGIGDVQKQAEFFDSTTHETIIAKLADIYAETVSKVGPKIMVKGDQDNLSIPENAAKIRALLLAGIRAALLWRQAGGSRWKLLLSRRKMQTEAELILRT